MLRSSSGSANGESLRITSTTLNKGVKIFQFLPWMPYVCCSQLFNQCLWMGLKLPIVVLRFQLGRISTFRAYTNLLVACNRFGKPCLRLDRHKVYSMTWNISLMLKTPNDPCIRYHHCGNFDILGSILS